MPGSGGPNLASTAPMAPTGAPDSVKPNEVPTTGVELQVRVKPPHPVPMVTQVAGVHWPRTGTEAQNAKDVNNASARVLAAVSEERLRRLCPLIMRWIPARTLSEPEVSRRWGGECSGRGCAGRRSIGGVIVVVPLLRAWFSARASSVSLATTAQLQREQSPVTGELLALTDVVATRSEASACRAWRETILLGVATEFRAGRCLSTGSARSERTCRR